MSQGEMTDLEKQVVPLQPGYDNTYSSTDDSQEKDALAPAPEPLHEESERAPLSRATTRRSGNSAAEVTRMMSRTNSVDNRALPAMGGGKPYPPEPSADREPYRVEFDGPDDPLHPHNWPIQKKLVICFALGLSTFAVSFGSAVFAPAIEQVCEKFHVGTVVGILGITLYIIGFASGPVVWAPMSELYGRKPPMLISMLAFTIFMFAVGAAKDFATIVLCRFFAGFFGAAPVVVVAAAFADLFNNDQRGTAITIFALMVFCGPFIAPVVGGFIANSYLHWRWVQYITGIMGALGLILVVFFYEETYHPILLTRKASELRRRTGNWGIFAQHETIELDLHDIVTKNLIRPLEMLLIEPILLLISIYAAFIYGILYLCLEAYPLIFSQYGFEGGILELPYLSLLIGQVVGAIISAIYFEPLYTKRMKANGGKILPENRLLPMMLGGVLFPIGIFWLCWTGAYAAHVHWLAPTFAGPFIGGSLLLVFLPAISYIIDCYLLFAASALAANTFLRSIFGAVFPLFATQMFNGMGIQWAGTLIGCVGIILAPVPFLFYKFGKKLRQKSKYAFDIE